jgi:hypothetical protein
MYMLYSAIAYLHNFQFTVAHELRFSVSTTRFLATGHAKYEVLTAMNMKTTPWRRIAGHQFHTLAHRDAAVSINFPDQCEENTDCDGNRFSELLTLVAPYTLSGKITEEKSTKLC